MAIEIKRNEPQKTPRAKREKPAKSEDTPTPKRTRAPNGTFDRTAYQREYMRDVKLAKAEGMTVKQWRDSKR